MRLKYIRLAGFKSFVDATKVAFPEQMTCIVGPNGCGKSNVIDAVRWVLGESSAKNLRGDAMTDVIFNGSSARKPVSQASVELVFDNSDGRLQGEFATFNEVSVKRVVTRDAQSLYFLNGSKCRRRDITDLFLGTGLGPRSYAIIEQGMISRLIESRPQELRVFIEEAAGISKYKERRKETESRIGRTRENLERLADVREELGQQLNKLQRQAAAARRYQTLKAEERRFKSELQALRWLHYQQQCDRVEADLNQQETELERWLAEQRGSERGQTELREREHTAQDQVDAAQERFYQSSTQVTGLEQQIRHQRQLRQQRTQQQEALARQRTQLQNDIDEEQRQHTVAEQQLESLREVLAEAEERHLIAEQQREDADIEFESWQDTFETERNARSSMVEQRSVLQAELRSGQLFMEQALQRQQSVQTALQALQQEPWADPDALTDKLDAQNIRVDSLTAEVEQIKVQRHEARIALEQERTLREQQQSAMQSLTGRKSSLEQLLQAQQQHVLPQVKSWLDEQHHLGRLRELLEIPQDFQRAVEAVLAPWLNSPVIQHQPDMLRSVPEALDSAIIFAEPDDPARQKNRTVAAFFSAKGMSIQLLEHIGLADSLDDAIEQLEYESRIAVCLPNGQVIGSGWVTGLVNEDQSQLAWQASLAQVDKEIVTLEQVLAERLDSIQTLSGSLGTIEARLEDALESLQEQQHHKVRLEEQRGQLAREREQAELRQQALTDELEALQEQHAELELQQEARNEQLERLMESEAEHELHFERAQQQGERLRASLRSATAEAQELQQQVHRIQLEMQQAQSQIQHVDKHLQRLQVQLQEVDVRLLEIQQEDFQHEDEALLEEQLAEALLRREQAEVELREAREHLSTVQQELGIIQQGQSAVLEQIAKQRERVEASKLELAASRERGHALLESFQELNVSLKEVLEAMPEAANESEWQRELDDRTRKITQLGAINLAAIEEVEAQAERKAYLDAQHEDLTASLETLEDAMKKIDRETRSRFKTTYDQVNHDLQQLFPKVFGGGSAYLELTDDDLLETGVTIMARPPGKKNSTIHLLSGGEKALTALALVFAIFRLNPAPFCLLDEVDAPLDDVNVGRFCRLVQEMSESVQFIYISHNKIAMEMATHLAGVTMQEPGVSRLVAVDVDEALALAEAS